LHKEDASCPRNTIHGRRKLNQSLAMIPDKGVKRAPFESRRSAEDRQTHKD
jgi:hypothetical protein